MAHALQSPPRTDAVLQRLMALHPKLIDLSLDRLQPLLARLGSPERQLPPVIHVAGTNGKGSLVAYLRAMFEAAGYRAHVYISPHLVRFNERIRLAGKIIEDEPLVEILETVERANGADPITFFEATTAAGLLAFARTPADVVLLETGLGGRYDATNIIDQPALTAITPIAFDHMDFFGHTLTLIAHEKTGIFKHGVPAVIGPQQAEASDTILRDAGELSVPLFRHGEDWSIETREGQMIWQGGGMRFTLPLPALVGAHQVLNAGTAIACIQQLRHRFNIDRDAMARGLRQVEWPARLQRLTKGPLISQLPPDAELWLDGGHNPHCAAAIADTLASWRATEAVERPLWLVFGMKNNKDMPGVLAPLAGMTKGLYGVAIPDDDNCFSPDEIAAAATALGIRARPASSAGAAIREITRQSAGQPAPRVLIFGSLYLAGQILESNG